VKDEFFSNYGYFAAGFFFFFPISENYDAGFCYFVSMHHAADARESRRFDQNPGIIFPSRNGDAFDGKLI
jgi:hypothetical protein